MGALLVCALSGCNSPAVDPDDATVEEPVLDGQADVVRPSGTYEGGGGPGTLVSLSLENNHQFSYLMQPDSCPQGGPCDPILRAGTYAFAKSGGTTYLKLSSPEGVVRYAYTLSGDTLSLRKAYTQRWFDLVQTTACAIDCGPAGFKKDAAGADLCECNNPPPLCAEDPPITTCGSICTTGYQIVNGHVSCECC
jgi:hypothetical protein